MHGIDEDMIGQSIHWDIVTVRILKDLKNTLTKAHGRRVLNCKMKMFESSEWGT